MAKQRALDFYYELPPGTALLHREPGGPILIKFGNLWPHYRVNEDHVCNSMLGTIHDIGDILPRNLLLDDFLKSWEVEKPLLSAREKLLMLAKLDQLKFFRNNNF